MKFIFFLSLVLSTSALPTFDWEKSNQRLEKFDLEIAAIAQKEMVVLKDIVKELKDFKEHTDLETKLFARRGFCGFELPKKIQKICGPILYSADETNIFGVCCLYSCSDAYIKTMMCPVAKKDEKATVETKRKEAASSSESSEDSVDSEFSEDEKDEDED